MRNGACALGCAVPSMPATQLHIYTLLQLAAPCTQHLTRVSRQCGAWTRIVHTYIHMHRDATRMMVSVMQLWHGSWQRQLGCTQPPQLLLWTPQVGK